MILSVVEIGDDMEILVRCGTQETPQVHDSVATAAKNMCQIYDYAIEVVDDYLVRN